VDSDTFVTIDVETANADLSSICQVGIARFSGGSFVDGWSSLIDPEDYFDGMNISIHGITEDDVAGAPKFPAVADEVARLLNDKIVISHGSFDRVAISRVCAKYSVSEPQCVWLDSCRVARRAWVQFARGGYGLANLAAFIEHEFQHHDALADAKAAGHIMLAAIRETGAGVQDWLVRARQPIGGPKGAQSREGVDDGPNAGECIVFTGALEMPRREASDLAAKSGFDVRGTVSKKTSMLVVGDQDIRRLGGHSKSGKHRKAEELIQQGVPIRIIGESDFRRLVKIECD
jgi:DNA polymerase-3 subunit epsilon